MYSRDELLGAFRLTASQFNFMTALTKKTHKLPAIAQDEMYDLVDRHIVVWQNSTPVLTTVGAAFLDVIHTQSA